MISLPGLLRLELPKEIYERAGLVGTPVRDGGRKHVKSRYGRRDFAITVPNTLRT